MYKHTDRTAATTSQITVRLSDNSAPRCGWLLPEGPPAAAALGGAAPDPVLTMPGGMPGPITAGGTACMPANAAGTTDMTQGAAIRPACDMAKGPDRATGGKPKLGLSIAGSIGDTRWGLDSGGSCGGPALVLAAAAAAATAAAAAAAAVMPGPCMAAAALLPLTGTGAAPAPLLLLLLRRALLLLMPAPLDVGCCCCCWDQPPGSCCCCC